MPEITKEFVETLLGQKISTLSVSEGCKAGDNVAGSLSSVKVSTTSGSTVNLVVKTITEHPAIREFIIRFYVFRVENVLYNFIRPRIETLMSRLGHSEEVLPVPKYYGAQVSSPDPSDDYIALEDIRPYGYIMPDKYRSLTFPEVKLIMKELAKFHAKTYVWIRYEGEQVFEETEDMGLVLNSALTNDDNPVQILMGKFIMYNETKNAVTVLKAQGLKDLASRVQKKYLDGGKDVPYQFGTQAARQYKNNEVFSCIIHGDIWGNNIMIKYDKEGNPEDLKFLDFQGTRRGSIFEDLGYFFVCSTSPEFRKNHLFQCLNTYFESFESTLSMLKCPLPLGFSRGFLIDNFCQLRAAFFVRTALAIPMQLADPVDISETNDNSKEKDEDEGELTEEQKLKRMEAGMEAKSSVFLVQMLKSPRAIQRLIEATEELANLNLI